MATELKTAGDQPPPCPPTPALSPTPSEILRPEGFMARSPICGDDDEDDAAASGKASESPTSEMDHDEGPDDDLDELDDGEEDDEDEGNEEEGGEKKVARKGADGALKVEANGKGGDDASQKDDASSPSGDSGVESERGDGFNGFEGGGATAAPQAKTPPPSLPSLPKVGSLTILAPSSLNNSVVNGTLSITPSPALSITPMSALSITPAGSVSGDVDSTDAFSLLNALAAGDVSQVGIVGDSNAQSDGGMHGFVDLPSSNEYMPLDRLAAAETCEVCGERTADANLMEVHRSALGHYKCHVSPDCAVVLFGSKGELAAHQLNVHHMQAPPPPLPPPVEQLAQQVERLPPAHGGSSPGPHALLFQPPGSQSPGPMYRAPAPQPISPQPPPPQPGTIQPRPFASMALQQRPRTPPPPPGSPGMNRGPVKRPVLPVPPGQPLPQAGGPPGKQRRLDILLPDRHDDADCHVIATQKRNDYGLQIQNVQGGGAPTNGFQLPDSISLTTRTGSAVSITPAQPKKGNDANAVANILATRGITVTPAGANRAPQQQPAPPPPQPVRRQSLPEPVVPQTLNLNSAISIIPTNQARQGGGFAVPQGRIRQQGGMPTPMVDRPPRCPTVDLTQDPPPVAHGRGRPPGRVNRHTCQVCDKSFTTADSLAAHMATHRSPGKLPYRCTLCNAQYPTQQGLLQHKQTFHKESPGAEMAFPVVDLKQPGLQSRLAALGIRHFVPLSQLQNQTGGVFGLPIVAIDNARNPAVCNLGALGASNILALGPLKTIGPR